jgi:ABC transporter DrrB family efflux protein
VSVAAPATAARVLRQLRRDPRTIALLLIVPCVLVALLKYLFVDEPAVFDRIGGPLLGLFPFIAMFVVTSITMLRERTTGTLERLMTLPLSRFDLVAGYGAAFALAAAVQATLVSLVAFLLLGLDVAGPPWLIAVLAVLNAVCRRSCSPNCSSVASSSRGRTWRDCSSSCRTRCH